MTRESSPPTSGDHAKGNALLGVVGVTAGYGPIVALQHVSVEVRSGEVVAVVGPNGAGKSTLLLTIAGVRHPIAGEVRFAGALINQRLPEDIARSGIALVPEGRRVFAGLTVLENLQVGSVANERRRGTSETIDHLLDKFPVLKMRRTSLAGQLSGGEQQQLVLARALVSQPRLLLLDEPSLGLAPKIVDVVYETLAELRDSGMTILLVEQHVMRALELADRAYVLSKGRITFSGPPGGLGTEDKLKGAYFGVGVPEEILG